MKKVLTNKLILFAIYIGVALLMESYYFLIQYKQVFPYYFLYDFCIIVVFGCITTICGKYKGQIVASVFFWTIQVTLATANFALSKANGDIFSWEMISLMIDAAKATTGAGGSKFIKLVHLLFFLPVIGCGLTGMILFYKKKIKFNDIHPYGAKNYFKSMGYAALVAAICMSCNLITVLSISKQNESYKVSSDAYLYDSQFIKQEALRKFGTFGFYYINAKSNLKKLFSDNDQKVMTLRTYLQQGLNTDTTNPYTGVSEGNNLIYILFETGEWFGINEKITPNLFSLITEDAIKDKNGVAVDGGIVLTNYHSKSQTNISEAQSLFGSYPLTGILNYNYDNNEYPFTLPSKFKSQYPNAAVNSYHSNVGKYYNRYDAHIHYGFDKHYAAEEMGLEQASDKTWIRMDSEMFGKCLTTSSTYQESVAPIVPENHAEPFFSYVISFSTHGPYTDRDYLEENKQYVKSQITEPFSTLIGDQIDLENEIYGEEVATYLAAAYDFDIGIGKLIDDLREKDELDKTTIMIFSDHYAYYSNLSATTKGYDQKVTTIPKIYNVPAFIFDSKLKQKMKDNMPIDDDIHYLDYPGRKILSYHKYCGNIDFTPTLLNLLGIDYNIHDYTGRDIFSTNSSFVLSRYGGMFNDRFYTSDGKTIDNMPEQYYYYQENEEAGVPIDEIIEIEGMSKNQYIALRNEINEFFIEASEFLVRQDYIDMIYRNDYYGKMKVVRH